MDNIASRGGFLSTQPATPSEAARYLGAAEARFDSIILDVNLPDGDGPDFCIKLHKLGHMMPIIVLSGASGDEAVILGLNAGANHCVSKPFRFNELLARLRKRGKTRGTQVQQSSAQCDRIADFRHRCVRANRTDSLID